ncbi:MAG: hypothetical protein HQK58_08995 [Deltaproteobacteria bacterium]|nr:hypothetical protein [Deltaproteobacteria bacterium]
MYFNSLMLHEQIQTRTSFDQATNPGAYQVTNERNGRWSTEDEAQSGLEPPPCYSSPDRLSKVHTISVQEKTLCSIQ